MKNIFLISIISQIIFSNSYIKKPLYLNNIGKTDIKKFYNKLKIKDMHESDVEIVNIFPEPPQNDVTHDFLLSSIHPLKRNIPPLLQGDYLKH